MWEAVWEAITESLISFPILLVVYFLMELLENKQQVKFEKFVAKSKKTGPLWGSVIGCVPQCAFSAVMADLFSKRMITIGTLLAVFIATSDEAIVILISTPSKFLSVFALLGFKVLIAIIVGFVADLFVKNQKLNLDNLHHSAHYNHEHSHTHSHSHNNEGEICLSCEHCSQCNKEKQNCVDCEHNKLHHGHELVKEDAKHNLLDIFLEALKHTLVIFLIVLITNVVLSIVLYYVGLEQLKNVLLSGTIFEPIILTLLGLIPNCGASVAIVDLYINGIVSFGSCVGALCTGAGLGLVILYKNNKNLKQNLLITLSLYLIGVVVGFLINLIPIAL